MICIHHYNIIESIFTVPHILCVFCSFLPHPDPSNCCSVYASIVLPLPEHHIVRIIQYIACLDWQLSFTNMHLNFTHVFLWPDGSFHFLKKVLFLVALGHWCSVQAFSSCDELWLLFVVVCGLLSVVASLVEEHRLQLHGLQ